MVKYIDGKMVFPRYQVSGVIHMRDEEEPSLLRVWDRTFGRSFDIPLTEDLLDELTTRVEEASLGTK